MSLESRATKSTSGRCGSPKAGNTDSYWEPAHFLQQTSLTVLGGTFPWLWFGLQAKNREGTIGFWINHLDTHCLWEGSEKSFTCQDLPFVSILQCPLPTSSTCLFFPFASSPALTCRGWAWAWILAPSMPTSHWAALIMSHCSCLLCFMAKVFNQG